MSRRGEAERLAGASFSRRFPPSPTLTVQHDHDESEIASSTITKTSSRVPTISASVPIARIANRYRSLFWTNMSAPP